VLIRRAASLCYGSSISLLVYASKMPQKVCSLRGKKPVSMAIPEATLITSLTEAISGITARLDSLETGSSRQECCLSAQASMDAAASDSRITSETLSADVDLDE